MRVEHGSGTLTPGTSLRHELRVPQALERHDASEHRNANALDALEELPHRSDVEDRLRHRKLGAGLDLVLEASDLLIEIERSGIGSHADVERRRLADRLAADIAARD